MKFLAIIPIIVFVLAGYFFFQNQQFQKPKAVDQALPTPSPVVADETENWKTYTHSNKLIFKYPPSFMVRESPKDFFNITIDFTNPYPDFSIDARLISNYVDYTLAVNSTKAGLTNIKETPIKGGLKIEGKISGDFRNGTKITIALFKYVDGAIEAETTTTDPASLRIFDQILGTFRFLD